MKILPNLSFVQLTFAGTNGYDDLSLYANPDVILATASGVYGEPMAEYVIGGMLCMESVHWRIIPVPGDSY